jgi:PAS domain S-box-containing protein
MPPPARWSEPALHVVIPGLVTRIVPDVDVDVDLLLASSYMTTGTLLRGAAASAAASRTALERIRPPPISSVWKYSLELAIVFAAYFVAGHVGFAVPFTTGNVSPVWPPAGIALAGLLLVGSRVWPAIAAGAFLVNFLSPISVVGATALAVGNTAGPVVAAWLVQRIPRFRPALARLNDVLALTLIAAPVGAVVSATVGVTVLFVTDVNPWLQFWPAWLVWWLGDTLGVLIVTPLALTLLRQERITRARHLPELVALLAVVVVTCFFIFDTRTGLGIEKDVLAFALLPLVLWGATRFQIPGAAGVTLVIAFVAAWETANGFGPFVRNTTLQNATLLQAFIAVIAVSGLTLAAVIMERAQLIREQTQREGLEQSDKRYREIVETANDGIWLLDARLMTVFVNRRMAAILGYTVEEMQGKCLSEFVSEAAWSDKQEGLLRRGPSEREHAQGQYLRKDGSQLWATVSRTRAFAEDGAFTGVLKMVNDSSDQKRAEGERQHALDSNVLLTNAVEQTADSVFISNRAGIIEYVNPAFERTTGYSRDEVLGNTPRLLKSGQHDDAFYKQMWASLLAGEPYRGTLVNRRKAGELYWASQTVTPITDVRGLVTHFVSVLKDVSDVRKYHEQEVQLELARTVQQRFNPAPPRVPGFDIAAVSYPSDETGGDYFDFIDAPNGVLYVAVGDVSGHGFDAALIMALTRAYMRSFATLGMDAGELLGRVNRAIVSDLEANRFVTMLIVRIDVEAGIVTYASAGHIPGVLLDGLEGIDGTLDSTGMPLGLFADATFATRQCRFRPDQIFVLSTDGATETFDAHGVEFGSNGVLGYVRSHTNDTAQDIAQGVYEAARSFGGSVPQQDDITAVIIKVTNAAIHVEQAPLPLETLAAA